MQVGTTKDQGLYNKSSAAVHPQYNTVQHLYDNLDSLTPNVRHRVYKSQQLDYFPNQLCLVHVGTPYLSNICFNVLLPPNGAVIERSPLLISIRRSTILIDDFFACLITSKAYCVITV